MDFTRHQNQMIFYDNIKKLSVLVVKMTKKLSS